MENHTTYWQDFSIADVFGESAVQDTFNRSWEQETNTMDVKTLTELVMVLNHKIWQHYQSKPSLAKIYNDLWVKSHDYCLSNLKDDDLSYYIKTTD